MKREEAVANAMSVFTFAELRQLGHFRKIADYEMDVELSIHFKSIGEAAHKCKKEIYPLLIDGTIIEEVYHPERGYECLDITWNITE